MKEDWWRK